MRCAEDLNSLRPSGNGGLNSNPEADQRGPSSAMLSVFRVSCFSYPVFPGRTRWLDSLLLCLLYVSLAPLMPTSDHARSHDILCHLIPSLTYTPSRCNQLLSAVGDVASSYCLQVGFPHYETILGCHGLVFHSPDSPTVGGLQGRTLFFSHYSSEQGSQDGDDEVATCP